MASMRNDRDRNMDVETLATWLNAAARELEGESNILEKGDGHAILRIMVRKAAELTAEMYGDVDEDDENPEINCIRNIIARFASALDEDERKRREDESANKE